MYVHTKQRRSKPVLWMDLRLLFSCSMIRFILKIVSAENCRGKRSTKCCSRISEIRCHKVTLLIARAACASVSHGFSSYSRSTMMRSNREAAQQSQKLLHLVCCTGQFVLWAQKDRRQPWGAKGLKAAGDLMSELDFKKQYVSHCK